MIAEIYHKTSSELEDELTGNFFGTMRYIPFQRGLKRILSLKLNSKDANCAPIIRNIMNDDFELFFWKRSRVGLGEIDALIDVENVAIGIEVKYYSSLSGENQLEREAEMLNEWYSDKRKKILILIAMENDAKRIYLENYRKNCFNNVYLGYITWQDILESLDYVKVKSKYEELMISDLKDLLLEKGFISFNGFNLDQLVINGGLYYEFR